MGGGQGGGEGGGESMSGGDDTGGTPVPQGYGEGGESSSESESSESESSETESSETESPCAELTEAECWDLYFEWAMEQCWGPSCEATGLEQFHAAQQKLTELGLR